MPLLVPKSIFARETRHQCLVPGCGADFPLDQYDQFIRHVKACAKRNSEVFERVAADRESSLFTSSIDPELRSHLKQGGT